MLDTCIGMKQLFGYQQQRLKDPQPGLCLLKISGNPPIRRTSGKMPSKSTDIYKMQVRSDADLKIGMAANKTTKDKHRKVVNE